MIKRIACAVLGLTLTVAHSAIAQPSNKLPKVGLLLPGPRSSPCIQAFEGGLRELGYVANKTVIVEVGAADQKLERLPGLAADLVRLHAQRRSSVIIALASPAVATSLDDGLDKINACLADASAQGAQIVCFPEAYLPGLRGVDFDVLPFDQADQERVLRVGAELARTYRIATILGMERLTPVGRQIAACVIDAQGQIQGYQAKTQLAPSEDPFYVPGNTRQLFEINRTKFGIAICHEGWRYPETVRWAAVRGARIVFHPHQTGSDHEGVRLTEWGSASAPYYEKAMMMRSIENTIFFASVNYGLRFQESATCVITPAGRCQAQLPYGQAGVLVQDVKLEEATGLIAARYAPERYPQ